MPSGLRSKLRGMMSSSDAPAPRPVRRETGLVIRKTETPVDDGIFRMSDAGLIRLGYGGKRFDPEKTLFLDTETTGLGGGAGTVAFLVGLGYVEGNRFCVEQYLMRDYPDEPELVVEIARTFERFDTLVTFNGKTFDMPLLKSRFTMMRMQDMWKEFMHIDLLTASRRIWKLRLRSCRLCNLEEQILGFEREDDIPGSEVPQRYFDFLKTGDMSLLQDIITHNRQDIESLSHIMVRLCAILSMEEIPEEKADLLSLGKTLERSGELSDARRAYEMAARPGAVTDVRQMIAQRYAGEANWHLSTMARRSGQTDVQLETLMQMVTRNQMGCIPYIELAKLAEHRQKDIALAIEYTKKALSMCGKMEEDGLNKRLVRLETKLEKDKAKKTSSAGRKRGDSAPET